MADRPDGHLKIGELVRQAGVGRGTIQHYVREGLLPAPVKTHKNMAYYDPACVERIRIVQRLRETRYLPLAEIRRVLASDAQVRGGDVARVLVDTQKAALSSISHPSKVPDHRLTLQEAAAEFLLPPATIERLLALHVVDARVAEGRRVLEGADLEVLAAIANFRRLGFNEGAGFSVEDLGQYREAIHRLVQSEIQTFVKAFPTTARGSDPVALAGTAVDGATLFLIAMRRKLILDFLAAERPRSPARPDKKRKRPRRTG